MLSDADCQRLANLAADADRAPTWPHASWNVLRRAGVLGWSIPACYGGLGYSVRELLAGYEQLAQACLTTCFLLSQREAACRRLIDSDREDLCRTLLPSLARGEAFATVGLSQLTTSRQHTGPSLRVRETNGAFILDGVIPWVTGAAQAQHIVIGATLDDGRQLLSVLPTDLPGVVVGPALDLMALEGSLTAEVRCREVKVERRWLLAGPSERVMQKGKGGAGGLETSCLALGLAAAALRHVEDEAAARPQLEETAVILRAQRAALRQEMFHLAESGAAAEKAVALRGAANALVLGATQAALTASKGAGFLRDHPAQRWARQALFFLVWSCPWPAAAATLDRLCHWGSGAGEAG
ncbi:MAG: acyl-CoA dehydrogenase family protein [Gemmataceae bacterium]